MHIFDVRYACAGFTAGSQSLFPAGFSVMDRGTGKIYHAMADFPVKQPYCTDLFLYQSNIYHGSKVKQIFSVIIKTIVLFTIAHYTWNCFNVFTTVSVREVSPTIQIPMVIPRFSMVVGLALTFLQALAAGGFRMLDEEEEA